MSCLHVPNCIVFLEHWSNFHWMPFLMPQMTRSYMPQQELNLGHINHKAMAAQHLWQFAKQHYLLYSPFHQQHKEHQQLIFAV